MRPARHTAPARRLPRTLLTVLRASVPLVLLIAYPLIWVALVQRPVLGGTDFISFYTAGRIARSGQLERLYDLDLQQGIQAPIVGPEFVPGGVLPYNHPPFLAPLLGMIAVDEYVWAYVRWTLVLLAVLTVCATVGAHWLRDSGWSLRGALLAAGATLLFYPTYISVLKGQDTALALLGALVWGWGLRHRRDWLAGAGLALVTIKPQLALALALPMLFVRPRAFGWFVAASASLWLFGLVLIGWQGFSRFIDLLRLTAGGEGYGFNQSAMFNLIGGVLRAAPQTGPVLIRVLAWGGFGLACAGLCWLWFTRRNRLDAATIGITIVPVLFFSPHLHYHDLGLLVVTLVALLDSPALRAHWGETTLISLVTGCALVALLTSITTRPWPYVLNTLILAGLVVAAVQTRRDRDRVTS